MNIILWLRDYLHWVGLLIFEAGLDLEAYLQTRAREEFYRLRRATAMAIGLPALLILVGAILGGYSQVGKTWFIGVSLIVLAAQLLLLAWRHAAVGGVLGILFEAAVRGDGGRNMRQVAVAGIADYVKVVMCVLFTEAAVGMLAIALPVHENPTAALLAAVAAVGYVAYTIYQRGHSRWPRVAGFILLAAMVIGVLMVLVPPLGDFIGQSRRKVVDAARQASSGERNPYGSEAAARAVSSFPLRYASLTPVAGSLAPRSVPPTIVTKPNLEQWEVSIDGSNEYGYREPAEGHRTGIRLPPGVTAHVQHLGGTLAYNALGDRVAICGTERTVYRWEQRPLPMVPIYATAVGYRTREVFHWGVLGCAMRAGSIRNGTDREVELVFVFNLNSHYRTPDGRSHSDGFAYGGWDGERARFAVRLSPGS